MPESTLLMVRDLHAFYGKSHVLHGVNLEVREGEVVSILGRNGSGRSTLAKAIMRLVDANGSITHRGRDLMGLAPFQIARGGIAFVPEDRDIFPTLTVEQNLTLGRKAGPKGTWTHEDMYGIFPSLMARRSTAAGVLSGGEQQMLTLCRALMGRPDLVIVDEPTEGLAPKIIQQLGAFIGRLRNSGIGVLLIEQKLDIAMDVSDRVYVMGHGELVFGGAPDELRRADEVRREWLEV